ncbi:MAG: hypothetical protein IH908_00890 [Proteobacteria bacterium]|nr:hypothetical protein [Pseudomonadota bacterium]
MKYMITFNHIEGAWEQITDEQRQEHADWLKGFMKELKEEKDAELVFLAPPPETRTVRRHVDGRIEVSEELVTSTGEFVGGYYVIEAESMDEAVLWAEKGRFLVGSNDVRPILELSS